MLNDLMKKQMLKPFSRVLNLSVPAFSLQAIVSKLKKQLKYSRQFCKIARVLAQQLAIFLENQQRDTESILSNEKVRPL